MVLNSKRRAALRSLGVKENPIVRIGKEGMSENIVKSLEDAITARELVKVKILNNSDAEVKESATFLAEKTGSEIVHIMGGTILFFRENKEHPTISLDIR